MIGAGGIRSSLQHQLNGLHVYSRLARMMLSNKLTASVLSESGAGAVRSSKLSIGTSY